MPKTCNAARHAENEKGWYLTGTSLSRIGYSAFGTTYRMSL
ncbi:MAG TPA: hypothetical protein VIM06_08180 [Rhodanobacter sp.]